MTLKISELDRSVLTKVENIYKFEEDNPSFEKAFEVHLKCAKALQASNLFREAYLSYLLSVECLLKDLYVLARAKVYGPDPTQSAGYILLKSQKSNEKEIKFDVLHRANKFSHDLASLIKFTIEIFPEFDRQNPPRFAALANAIDVKIDWISERYQDPAKISRDWKSNCEQIENSLKTFVKEDLFTLYPGVNL